MKHETQVSIHPLARFAATCDATASSMREWLDSNGE